MAKRPEVFVDTDVLTAYLEHSGPADSALKQLMTRAVCFTSVLNAGELVAIAHNDDERFHAESVLWGLKVLGFHHKYSLQFGDLHRAASHRSTNEGTFRDSMVAGICILNKLPLCTCNTARYRAYTGVALVDAAEAVRTASWDELAAHIHIIDEHTRTP